MKRSITFLMMAAFMLLSGLSWAQTKESVTVSYGWETTDDATEWTISDAIVSTADQGNTGDYAGKINTNHTYVQFNEKVFVTSFSFAFKRTSNNSNYNVYIETSTDGDNWTAVETYAMGSFYNGTYLTKTHEFDGTTEYYVRFHCYNTTAVRYVDDVTITYSTGAAELYPSDFALVNTELSFDLYNNADAQVINYTTSSTGVVTVVDNEYITTVVDETNKTITVTPLLVTQSTQTITVNQAADDNYASGTASFTVNIADSTPFTGGDVTFDATIDKGTSPLIKNGVTFACDNGVLNNGSEYRLYKYSTTTFSVEDGTITSVAFSCTSSNAASGFATQTGWTTNGDDGTWTGNATSVSFVASGAQVRATQIVVTVNLSATPDPIINAENVSIEYNVESGSITYTINNEIEGGVLTAGTESDWLSLGEVGETIPFTCSANETSAERTATVVLTYTYGDNETVSKDVTVTQAAAPVIYTTIPDLFAAATATETSVLVTFNNWVVSGVSTNGKNVFVTDNNGNGFVIYYNNDMSSTFAAGNILTGTAVSCTLKKYNGFAELLNVTATDLTITSGGTIAVADVAMADLAGVNTGALLHYDNLTCVLTTNSAGTTTFYNLTDGTTTIQVYNAIYAFGTLVEGKTYNITGVYQQYNNTKEILPRSAEDIEEVVTPIQDYDLTVEPFENLEIITFVNDEMVMEADGEIQVNEGAHIMLSIVADEGYVLETLMVNGVNHVNDIADDFTYEFDMPAEAVTISATAIEYVAPTPGSWVLTNLADLTADDIFVIVGDNGDTYAMSNDNGTSAPAAVSITVVEGTLSSEPADNLKWNLGITNNGYIFYPNGDTENSLYCTNTNNGVKVGTSEANVFSLDAESGYLVHNATSRYIGIYNSQDWRCYLNTTGNIAGQTFAFYKKVVEPTTETHTLEIAGYGNSDGGYYLIASPVASVTPSTENGFITNAYDLYWFDQTQEDEWQNYKSGTFDLVSGMGYLYASQAGTTLTFEGMPYDGDGVVSLVKDDDAQFAGWNLVGNPFGVSAYIDRDFYIMNPETGAELIQSSGEIAAMQGIFVIANEDGEDLTFTTEAPATNDNKLVLNVTRNRGNVIDRAIVRFGERSQLPKFQLHENSTKISIAKDNKDYAVVSSETQGEMSVNFQASENGTYTFSVNTENIEMDYLHLIDNMTGADIDMIATPSYSFEAKTTDYTNRFRLVFNANNGISEQGNDNFAFFNGSKLIVNDQGEATLQVVDILGRVISSQNINGNENINLNIKSGAYMIRLINGNDVKTQKIVVE